MFAFRYIAYCVQARTGIYKFFISSQFLIQKQLIRSAMFLLSMLLIQFVLLKT